MPAARRWISGKALGPATTPLDTRGLASKAMRPSPTFTAIVDAIA